MTIRSRFRAYPSMVHGYYAGTRDCAFYADTVVWDTNGEYSAGICGLTASRSMAMHLYFNMLFNNVPANTYLTPLIFVRRAGGDWKEWAGTDIVGGGWPDGPCPQGRVLVTDIELAVGDSIQARPSFNSKTAATLALCQSLSSDGIVTCNYWGGFEIG